MPKGPAKPPAPSMVSVEEREVIKNYIVNRSHKSQIIGGLLCEFLFSNHSLALLIYKSKTYFTFFQ